MGSSTAFKRAILFGCAFGFLGATLTQGQALADDIYLDQTRLALRAKQEVFLSLKVSGDQPFIQDTPPTGNLGANLEWNFVKSYSVGVEFSYKRPFTTEAVNYSGANDVAFYATDKELYSDRPNKFNLSYKMSAVLPTSQRSQNASLFWALSEEALARKGFGEFSLMYALDVTENFYQYDTVSPSASALNNPNYNPKYNSPLNVANRLVGSLRFLRDFHWQNAAQIRSSTDFNNYSSSIYSFSTGFTYEAQKSLSFDCGIRTTVRDTGVPQTASGTTGLDTGTGSSGGAQYIGDRLFDPYGTLFYFGTTIKI